MCHESNLKNPTKREKRKEEGWGRQISYAAKERDFAFVLIFALRMKKIPEYSLTHKAGLVVYISKNKFDYCDLCPAI